MVRIYEIRSPHYPTNVISLTRKTSEIRFLSVALVASFHKVAFTGCTKGHSESPVVKVKQPGIFDNHRQVTDPAVASKYVDFYF